MLNIRRAISGTCASHYSPEVVEIWAGRLRPEKYAETIGPGVERASVRMFKELAS